MRGKSVRKANERGRIISMGAYSYTSIHAVFKGATHWLALSTSLERERLKQKRGRVEIKKKRKLRQPICDSVRFFLLNTSVSPLTTLPRKRAFRFPFPARGADIR